MWRLLLGPVTVLAFTFVALPSRNQSIKMHCQIQPHFKDVAQYYSPHCADLDPILETSNNETFMLMDENKMAAFVTISKEKCYSLNNRKEYDFFMFFYCTVHERFRGQGLSYEILRKSVAYLKDYYSLRDDTFLTLHVSPYDAMMPISSRAYYKLGFTKGMFVEHGPRALQHRIDEVLADSKDMFDIARDPTIAAGTGPFLMLYCRLKDFGKYNAVPDDSVELTKSLYEVMKERVSEKPVNI